MILGEFNTHFPIPFLPSKPTPKLYYDIPNIAALRPK